MYTHEKGWERRRLKSRWMSASSKSVKEETTNDYRCRKHERTKEHWCRIDTLPRNCPRSTCMCHITSKLGDAWQKSFSFPSRSGQSKPFSLTWCGSKRTPLEFKAVHANFECKNPKAEIGRYQIRVLRMSFETVWLADLLPRRIDVPRGTNNLRTFPFCA